MQFAFQDSPVKPNSAHLKTQQYMQKTKSTTYLTASNTPHSNYDAILGLLHNQPPPPSSENYKNWAASVYKRLKEHDDGIMRDRPRISEGSKLIMQAKRIESDQMNPGFAQTQRPQNVHERLHQAAMQRQKMKQH